MIDVIVVGAGVFGSTIAAELAACGMVVRCYDSAEPNAGSPPSAGLIKPSWYSGMGKDFGAALERLDALWGVSDLEFRVKGGARATVHRVDPAAVLRGSPLVEAVAARVDWLDCGAGFPAALVGAERVEARKVVVAAGVWSGKLLQIEGLTGKAGASFTWQGQLAEPFISPWAPYKQVVAFNQDEATIWAGDGSAILASKWSEERAFQSRSRCAKAAELDPEGAQMRWGVRPFIKGAKPCLLTEAAPNVWLATGGAKSGMIGAGHAARLLGEALI